MGERCGEAPDLWRDFGDIARQVRLKLIAKIAGDNGIVGEAVYREVVALRRAWAGEHPTPLETALAEWIAANWLNLRSSSPGEAKRADKKASASMTKRRLEVR